jgi:hypothetical protein
MRRKTDITLRIAKPPIRKASANNKNTSRKKHLIENDGLLRIADLGSKSANSKNRSLTKGLAFADCGPPTGQRSRPRNAARAAEGPLLAGPINYRARWTPRSRHGLRQTQDACGVTGAAA